MLRESRQVKRQKLQGEPEEKESEQKVEPLVQAQMRINDLGNEQTETVAAARERVQCTESSIVR
jgi:hypothetical protein